MKPAGAVNSAANSSVHGAKKVAPPNQAPVLDLNGSAGGVSTELAYAIGGPLCPIAPSAAVSDVNSADFQGGFLRVSLSANGTSTDWLGIITDATVTLTGADNAPVRTIKINGVAIGTATGGSDGADLVVKFFTAATATQVEILITHIGYSSNSPSTLPRSVTFTLTDGDGTANGGHDTAVASATINSGSSAPPPNAPPQLTGDLSATVAEGGSYVLSAADLGWSDPDDGAADVTFTVFNPVNGSLQVNGVAAASFTGQQLLDGLVTFAHDGSETGTATFDVQVEDGNEDGSAPTASTFSFTIAPVNDAPTLTGALSATVAEGGSYVLSAADLGWSDPDDGAAGVTFTVLNPVNGSLLVNGVAAASFTGQQLLDGLVTFVHDGSETGTATFDVQVEDGNEDGSAPTASTFSFTVEPVNDAPTLAGTLAANVIEGGRYMLTPADLGWADADDGPSDITFTVSGMTNGTVKVNGVIATTFTGQQLLDGLVIFAHDGSNTTTASFDVQVEDGNEDGSAPVASQFNLTVLPSDIDLSSLSGSAGFIIEGVAASDHAGWSVSLAGDINGDGFDDLIVGAPLGNTGDAGEAYVVFGKASGFGTLVGGRQVIDLASLSASDGFVIQGDLAGDQAGWSVSGAGDVNGDGFADIILGARGGDDGGSNAGEAYVLFGKASAFGTLVGSRQVLDLTTTLVPSDGFIIQGDAANDFAGSSVASAGDINGDGFDDLIVGVPGGDDGGSAAGEAYVVFGRASGYSTIDLATLAPAAGFIIQGDAANDFAGSSVSSAGDINGDGYDDLIVGAPGGDDGASSAGEAYVLFGKASGFGVSIGGRQVIDLSVLAPTDGFIIQGDSFLDQAGLNVSSAGDVNGDGIDDLLVSAPLGDDGGTNAGETYVVFGSTSGFGVTIGGRQVLDLTGLSPSAGFIIRGDTVGDQAGWAAAAAGDVNGDGYGDLIVGAPTGDRGGIDAGQAYILFGKASGFGTITGGSRVLDLTNLSALDGFMIQGDNAGDNAGWSVSAAGDVNGDGLDDVIVGAPLGDDGAADAGEAYVIFGSAFWGP